MVNKNKRMDFGAGTANATPATVSKYSKDIPTLVDAPKVSMNVERPMALRGPLVIAGWGYDTDGLTVPNMKYDGDSVP